jgi:lipid II:glycine glycyltransferase (peptidoglycan interpeptide bridge formation enzyme)
VPLIPIHDPAAWDRALLALPNPHILQSWAWGEFKSRHGWAPIRVLFREGGRTLAAASILQRRLSHLPVSILYVPKGPVLDWRDGALAEQVLGELQSLACHRRSLFVKIDPDVYYPDQFPTFSPRPACAHETAHLLRSRGWCFSGDQIQFRNTLLLDLERPEEDLLASMKPKTRYNTGLAARRGVTVRHITAGQATREALDLFYRLYAETARRDDFVIRPPAYYHDAWGTFLKEGSACLLLAEYEGEAVAGLLLFTLGPTAWYMYGASSDRHRQHMPNHLLQWEAIRWAKAAGCTLYDLWGAPDSMDESDPMWGVVRFKLGLGGELARGVGAWDFPANRTGYRLYTEVVPRYLSWLRRRKATESGWFANL